MLLLGKLFDLRNNDNSDEDKPFLEHLDDLRMTLIKIAVTLVIGLGLCFGFRNDLMEIMRRPINGVWQLQLNTALHDLPVEIKAATWEKAAKAASDGQALNDVQRTYFFESLADGDPDFYFHAESIVYFRTALAMKGKKAQKSYIDGLPDIDDRMRAQLHGIIDYYNSSEGTGPDPDADSRQRTVFMQSLHPTEGFMLSFKLALYAGITVTFPFLLYFILEFILPGLHKKEKKALLPALAIGFGLFLTGVLFAYFLVLPRVLEFFSTFSGEMGINNEWTIGKYISFTTQFILIFGLSFELPVVIMTLVFLGIMDYRGMSKSRSYAILGIMVTAAVITPTPDVMTLMLLAGPMYLLYELCILLSWIVQRKQIKREEEEEAEEEKARQERIEKIRENHAAATPLNKLAAPAGLISHDDDYHESHEDGHDPYHEIDDYHESHADEHDPYHEIDDFLRPIEVEEPDILPEENEQEGNGEAINPDEEDEQADKQSE